MKVHPQACCFSWILPGDLEPWEARCWRRLAPRVDQAVVDATGEFPRLSDVTAFRALVQATCLAERTLHPDAIATAKEIAKRCFFFDLDIRRRIARA